MTTLDLDDYVAQLSSKRGFPVEARHRAPRRARRRVAAGRRALARTRGAHPHRGRHRGHPRRRRSPLARRRGDPSRVPRSRPVLRRVVLGHGERERRRRDGRPSARRPRRLLSRGRVRPSRRSWRVSGRHAPRTAFPWSAVTRRDRTRGRTPSPWRSSDAPTTCLTSFGAQDGDDVLVAVDLRGAYHGDFPFWNATAGRAPQAFATTLLSSARSLRPATCTRART